MIRLCANTGAQLHLVRPLGFEIDDRQLKRAGLDYHEYARMQVHDDLDAALAAITAQAGTPPRMFALSTRGRVRFDAPDYREHDAFLFGSETAGLPPEVLARVQRSGGDGVRGLAAGGFRGRRITPAAGAREVQHPTRMTAVPCRAGFSPCCDRAQRMPASPADPAGRTTTTWRSTS